MTLRVMAATCLAAVAGWAQAPAGRWDGTIVFGALKIPFTIYFEASGAALRKASICDPLKLLTPSARNLPSR